MHQSCFDVLEPRAMLSAPTAAVQSFGLTPDTMTLVVRYEADTGINASTVGTSDVGVTGPGVSRFAESAVVVSSDVTSATVRYLLRRAGAATDHDQWPIGTHNLGVAAGAVRSNDGAGNVEAGAGSYYLWYPDTVLELRSAALTGDGWTVRLTRWMRSPDMQNAVTTQVRISGPGGANLFQTSGIWTAHNPVVTLNAGNPDGLWDFSDTGTYSLDVATYYTSPAPTGFQPTSQYWLWFTNPKVEILSTDFTDSEVLITARFTDDHGIDASSISWPSVSIDVGAYHIPPTIDLYCSVEPQQDGSVIATFKRGFYSRGWTSRETGDWLYRTNPTASRARDIDGNPTGVGVIMHQAHTFTTIALSIAQVAASADDPSSLTFSMRFFPDHVDLGSLSDNDVRLELNGQTYQLSLVGYAPDGSADGHQIYKATYRLTLPQDERLTSGTANFYLNSGALTISDLPSTQMMLGSWWLWFS